MYKIRTVKKRGAGGGDDSCKNETTKESDPVACNREDCPVNCQYGSPTEWVRTRSVGKCDWTHHGSCAGDDCDPWTLVCARVEEQCDGWSRDTPVKVQPKHGGTACVSQKENARRSWWISEPWNCPP